MTNRTKTVLNGFVKLTADEQREFIDALNDYLRKPEPSRGPIREDIAKGMRVTLGPVGSGCICCGR